MPETDSIWDSILASGGGGEGAGYLAILSDGRLEKLLVTAELPPPAVIPFATLMMVADRMQSKVLKNWARRFLQAQTIKDRKRTLELVELFQASRSRGVEED